MRSFLRVAVATAVTAAALTVVVPPASAAGSYKVTADSSRSTLEPGQSTKISGKVTGGPVKGEKVTLYWISAAKDNAKWKKIGTAKLSSSGKYAKYFTPKEAGPTIVRVVKSAGSGKKFGRGQTGAFDVFKWQKLSAYSDGSAFYGSQQVNGKSYTDALIIGTGSTPDFTTSEGECKAFRSTVGFATTASSSYSGKLGATDAFLDVAFVIELSKTRDVVDLGFRLYPNRDLTLFSEFSVADSSNAIVLPRAEVLCNAPL